SAATTSPSPWKAHCRASAPQLARASVPGAIPFHFPLLASPTPCPEPPEHRRQPPERRRSRAHHRPHLQTTSAHVDPTNSSVLSSRSSQTPSRHLFSTRATSPPFPELRPP